MPRFRFDLKVTMLGGLGGERLVLLFVADTQSFFAIVGALLEVVLGSVPIGLAGIAALEASG